MSVVRKASVTIGALWLSHQWLPCNSSSDKISKSSIIRDSDKLRIIGGTQASIERYPYAVSLQAEGNHVCGGSLIAPDIVLTAAHCNFGAKGINTFNVVVGRYDLSKVWTGESIKSSREIPYPGYVEETDDNDINIVLLSRQVSVTNDFVKLNFNQSIPDFEELLTVVGWGDLDADTTVQQLSTVLMETDLVYISNEECSNRQGLFNSTGVESYADLNGRITENMLCAENDWKDSCQGDSGGPLILKGAGVSSDVQVGVVSWGLGCAANNLPGVYARISSQFKWIRKQVCSLSASPPTSFHCNDEGYGGMTFAPVSVPGISSISRPSGTETLAPTHLGTSSVTVAPFTSSPSRSPLRNGLKRLTMVVELDDMPSDTGWNLTSWPENEVIYSVNCGEYTSSQADGTIEYEFQVKQEQFYHLKIYDKPGNGFSGTMTIYKNGIVSTDTLLLKEPGFSSSQGREVTHGFYVGDSPEKEVTLNLKFDYYPNEVAYELKNLYDNTTLGMSWFETFQSGTKSAQVTIPIYSPNQGDQKYLFRIWDAGDDGICCSFGQGKYELYLGPLTDDNLLTSGGNYGQIESHEFNVAGVAPTPSPNQAPQTTSSLMPSSRAASDVKIPVEFYVLSTPPSQALVAYSSPTEIDSTGTLSESPTQLSLESTFSPVSIVSSSSKVSDSPTPSKRIPSVNNINSDTSSAQFIRHSLWPYFSILFVFLYWT